MNASNIFRFGFVGLLWVGLVYYILSASQVTLMTYFAIVASGIIIFVPMYKKYIKNKKD